MDALRAVTLKDLRRRLADPTAIAMWVGIPLVIGALMVLGMGGLGGDGKPPRAHVLVADEDGEFLGGLLAGAFGQARDVFVAESVSRADGLARIDAGDASALLIVPAGFTQALLDDAPIALELVTNPAQRILPGIVEGTLAVIVDGVFYAQQIAGDEIRLMTERPPEGRRTLETAKVVAMAGRINELVERVVTALDPPLIDVVAEVEVEQAEDERPTGLPALMFPGIVFMALLFAAQGLAEDFWRERDQGTLRRLLTTPAGLATFLGGKVLSGAVLIAGVVLVALLAGAAAFDIPLARLPLAWGWATLSGVVLFLIFAPLVLVSSSARGATTLTNMLVFPLMMVGGAFFPLEAMPDWMAAIGRWTPNGWALIEFKALLGGAPDGLALGLGLAGLGVAGGLLFGLSLWRLSAGFARR